MSNDSTGDKMKRYEVCRFPSLYGSPKEFRFRLTAEIYALLADADRHQLGKARAYLRYGIVRLVSLFRRVG